MSSSRLVVFALAAEEYALPIETVREVIRYTAPRSIGAAEPWMVGVVSVRGTIVPVCDLALRLGREAARPTRRSCSWRWRTGWPGSSWTRSPR